MDSASKVSHFFLAAPLAKPGLLNQHVGFQQILEDSCWFVVNRLAMKVLIVLLGTFCIAIAACRLITGDYHWTLSGNIAMCAMLCFTAIGHFAFTKGMTMMMPPFIPFKKELVLLTGVLEIAGGIGLLFVQYRTVTAICLLIFFVLILPAKYLCGYEKGRFSKSQL